MIYVKIELSKRVSLDLDNKKLIFDSVNFLESVSIHFTNLYSAMEFIEAILVNTNNFYGKSYAKYPEIIFPDFLKSDELLIGYARKDTDVVSFYIQNTDY